MPNVLGGRTSGFKGSAQAQAGRNKTTSSSGNKNKAPMGLNMFTGAPEQLKPNTPNPFTQKSGTLTRKTTASGNKPGEDAMAVAEANPVKLNNVQEAVLESRRQRQQQSTGLDIAQGIMSVTPAVGLSTVFGLGRKMGKMAEDEAFANPGRFTTIPGDPGAIKSVSGPLTSNRALSAPSAKTIQASADETTKKKKPVLKTILGTTITPLGPASGTKANPAKI